METPRTRRERAGQSRICPETAASVFTGRRQPAPAVASDSTLMRLRRELLQRILDREVHRRAARAFAAVC
ncbi:MAG: hypothetical protein GXX96_07885 [Planctomycetaceae bacterium]|nr:hypothetical protein [Planctomycetaceae bacterium]